MTEKLLTYALGRGLEYYDEHTVDEIVERLDREQGKFSALLMGIIESAPFQKQRRAEVGAHPKCRRVSAGLRSLHKAATVGTRSVNIV